MNSERIRSLDHIRGLSILGILLVNSIAFVQPFEVYSDPTLSHIPLSHADLSVWWLTETFFRDKFITAFNLLFGVSMYLVGRDNKPNVVIYKTPLFRRLGWLVIFGLIHGALIWQGDILLLYAVVGFAFWRWRNAPAKTLLIRGTILYLAGAACQLVPFLLDVAAHPHMARPVYDIAGELRAMQGHFASSLAGNFRGWTRVIIPEIIVFLPTTLGLMMLGLGLLKAGVLSGEGPRRLYLGLITAGAVSLVIIGYQAWLIVCSHFAFPDSEGVGAIANTLLCLLVTLGYISVLILAGRTRFGAVILHPLACAGQMAFTNYLTQSLIMTAIFFGGRGLGLYATMNHAGLVPIVAAIWLGQGVFSTLWMRWFRYGPFEWGWRCLTYAKWVGILRS